LGSSGSARDPNDAGSLVGGWFSSSPSGLSTDGVSTSGANRVYAQSRTDGSLGGNILFKLPVWLDCRLGIESPPLICG